MNNSSDFISSLIHTTTHHCDNPQFWLLVDPDRIAIDTLPEIASKAEAAAVDAILVGSSILVQTSLRDTVSALKSECELPVIIFPGGNGQLASNADALLFLTFLSSRNPRWLVDEQVLAASTVKRMKLPTIPTGYLLIESGTMTSVGFFSGSPPLPRDKSEITVAHALAAQFMGMHAVFLEAGSGAQNPVPMKTIEAVAKELDIAIIVGGGIRSIADAEERARIADVIVVGNFFESPGKVGMLQNFTDAVHGAR